MIRTDTLHELFAVASLLATQPVPGGDRVAIVTNAGGPGIMCADACHADGVDVPQLPDGVKSRLSEFLPAGASLHNPIDVLATASAEDYQSTLRTLIEAQACDAILAIFVPSLVTEARDVASAIRQVAEAQPGVPIATVFMTSEGPPKELSSDGATVPGYEFPEDAARAIALAAKHGRWRTRPQQDPWALADSRPNEAAAIISQQLASGPDWLELDRVVALLNCYGVPRSRRGSSRTWLRRSKNSRNSALPSCSRRSLPAWCTSPMRAESDSVSPALIKSEPRPPRLRTP